MGPRDKNIWNDDEFPNFINTVNTKIQEAQQKNLKQKKYQENEAKAAYDQTA